MGEPQTRGWQIAGPATDKLELQKRTVWLIRVLGLFAASIIIPFRYLLPADAYDPMWMRYGIGLFLISAVVLSFFWKGLTRYASHLMNLACLIYIVWILHLALGNNLRQEYTVSYFLILFVSLNLIKDWRWLIGIIVVNILLTLPGIFSLDHPAFEPWTFLAMVVSVVVITMLGFMAGLVEFRYLSDRGRQLRSINRAAFGSASEAIVVTDSAGESLHCNRKFRELWGVGDPNQDDGPISDWLAQVQGKLENPQEMIRIAMAVNRNKEQQLVETVPLIDGRFVKLQTRPVLEGTNVLGRMWFFRDVTASHMAAQAQQALQERLRRQNQTLVRLSMHDVMLGGEFTRALGLVTAEVAAALGADRVGIWMLKAEEESLICQDIYFATTDHHDRGFAVRAGQSPDYFHRLVTERVIHVPDASHDPLTSGFSLPYLTGKSVRNLMDAPLRVSGRLYGVLSAERDGKGNGWTPEDQQFLASMGDVLTVLIEAEERFKAEQELASSAAVFKAVFEATGVGILVTRPDRSVIDCNDTYLNIFKLEREFALRGDPDEVVQHCRAQIMDQPAARDQMKFLLENPRSNHATNLRFKDGRIVERFTEVVQLKGEVIGRVWFYRDITERARAEQVIAESEVRNKAIIEAIPDLMMRIVNDGRILDAKMPDHGPLSRWELRPGVSHLREYLPDELVRELLVRANEALGTGELVEYETEYESGREQRDLEVRLMPSGAGEVLLMLRDVTERKKTERELVQRNHELDSFVYRASHDLKAPLNSLMGLIEILKSESKDASLLTYLSLMDKSVVKLDTFIKNLTDFSKVARSEIRNQAVDFQEIIQEVLEGLRYMQNADRVLRKISITGDFPFHGDSFHIGIVMGNLLSNAVKYQDLRKPESWLSVTVDTRADRAVITVEDNGVGIPEEHKGRIFELFYRATNQSFGSGLGLYITRNAVEKMNGTIQMESTEGAGTKFTVMLPNRLANAKETKFKAIESL
ncbi:MAG: ATP-binding protein [Bacteroidia bacterium]